MLTSKQIKDLPKGTFKNSDLARISPSHGRNNRVVRFPVDKHGNVIHNIMEALQANKIHGYVSMRLNRRMAKQYGRN